MGPFPHDAPRAKISEDNPAGTNGFEFVEFAHPDPEALEALFARMGYEPVARHRDKAITVWRQGDINYILNAEKGSFADRFVDTPRPLRPVHGLACRRREAGAGACGVEGRRGIHRFRQDARRSGHRRHRRIAALFRRQLDATRARCMTRIFELLREHYPSSEALVSLSRIHLTHNVIRWLTCEKWLGSLPRLYFNFKQHPLSSTYEGKLTGARILARHQLPLAPDSASRSKNPPTNQARIDENSLRQKQCGMVSAHLVEHRQISMADDEMICRDKGVRFMTRPPDTYYETHSKTRGPP